MTRDYSDKDLRRSGLLRVGDLVDCLEQTAQYLAANQKPGADALWELRKGNK